MIKIVLKEGIFFTSKVVFVCKILNTNFCCVLNTVFVFDLQVLISTYSNKKYDFSYDLYCYFVKFKPLWSVWKSLYAFLNSNLMLWNRLSMQIQETITYDLKLTYYYKIENGNGLWRKCQRDNNPTKEQITSEGHQWVFNATKNPQPGVLSWPLNKNAY